MNKEIEKLTLKDGDILAIKDGTPEQIRQLQDSMESTTLKNILIISVPKDQTIEALDEEQMEQCGWVRIETLQYGKA